jgi:predicted  nucleic acid-binding Zn-ribbon protein
MKKKRSTHKTPSTKDSLGVISYQLSEIHKDLAKNSKDIEDLKHQVSMGKGGIKAVFVIGSIVAIILTAIKILKG